MYRKVSDVSLPPKFTEERIKYFMRMAKSVQDSENPCYSRQLGSVVADPRTGDLVSVGHNGPPEGCLPCDNEEYLLNVVWPQLTEDERTIALGKVGIRKDMFSQEEWNYPGHTMCDKFVNAYKDCRKCPRKLIDAPSGKRLELCSCAHSEHNACVKAHRDITGCWIFCWMGVPCIECCKTIINSGIATVVAIYSGQDDMGKDDYSPYSSRWLLQNAKVNLYMEKEGWYEK